MKKISRFSTVSIIVMLAFIVPQIAFAAWWNPISWFNGWSFFHRTDMQTQVLEDRVKELEKQLANTATSTPVIATTTKAVAPIKVKVTETPVPKKVDVIVAPVQTVTPVQPATAPADSQLLIVEKCKAKRDESKGPFWIALLQAVTLKEQKYQQTVMDVLTTSYPPGTVSGSALGEAIKITPAQHEKNLDEVRALMEAELAKEYSACLSRG